MPPKAAGKPSDSNAKSSLPAEAELLSLRSGLFTLHQAFVQLQDDILLGGSDTMMPWTDLVSRFSSLLSQAQGISMQLQKSLHAGQADRGMERSLSRIVAHPARPVETARENEVINMLRATARWPTAERDRDAILDTLPAHMRLKDPEDLDSASEALQHVQEAMLEHDRLATFARKRVGLISGLDLPDESDDEDEEDDEAAFYLEKLPTYDWHLRLQNEAPEPSIADSEDAALLQRMASIMHDGR